MLIRTMTSILGRDRCGFVRRWRCPEAFVARPADRVHLRPLVPLQAALLDRDVDARRVLSGSSHEGSDTECRKRTGGRVLPDSCQGSSVWPCDGQTGSLDGALSRQTANASNETFVETLSGGGRLDRSATRKFRFSSSRQSGQRQL